MTAAPASLQPSLPRIIPLFQTLSRVGPCRPVMKEVSLVPPDNMDPCLRLILHRRRPANQVPSILKAQVVHHRMLAVTLDRTLVI
jgi:hypothetical protein